MEPKEVILITGSNGLIAKQLTKLLSSSYEVRLLSRKPSKPNVYEWNIQTQYIDENALKNVTHIIHLAGAGIADNKWTDSRKKEIISSRVAATKLLLDSCMKQNIRLQAFISASAIGFYGQTNSDTIFTETHKPGNDFVSDVCIAWENAADEFEQYAIAERVVKLRTGIVMSKDGGALPKMLLPLHFYTALIMGNGKQYFPWIHIEDICSLYAFAINNVHIKGAYNAVSKEHITYAACIKAAIPFYKKPMLTMHAPSFMLKLALGKRASLLLYGSRVSNTKISQAGFSFRYNSITECLSNLLVK